LLITTTRHLSETITLSPSPTPTQASQPASQPAQRGRQRIKNNSEHGLLLDNYSKLVVIDIIAGERAVIFSDG